MNNVVLIGRITRDVELKLIPSKAVYHRGCTGGQYG